MDRSLLHQPSALATAKVLIPYMIQRKLRHWFGGEAPTRAIAYDEFRARFQKLLGTAESGSITDATFFRLPANQPPWFDTHIDLKAGEQITILASGRTYLNRFLDIWVEPHFKLWMRIGEHGTARNGTRNANTFTADADGRLYLGNAFPGEWKDETGLLATPEEDYKPIQGETAVLVLQWASDPLAGLKHLAQAGDCENLIANEIDRLSDPPRKPKGWDYLWFIGTAEAYTDSTDPKGNGAIACHTHEDVGILQKEVPFPLNPKTTISWSWKVDELPSDYAEIAVPTHDYMSIAVEFDDGQDLTYYWSVSLPIETIYRCPLPNWNARETHLVVRSGKQGLGEWSRETRNVYEDCERAYGKAPENIVRIWLIANSLFQRKQGRCEYANVKLEGGSESVTVI